MLSPSRCHELLLLGACAAPQLERDGERLTHPHHGERLGEASCERDGGETEAGLGGQCRRGRAFDWYRANFIRSVV